MAAKCPRMLGGLSPPANRSRWTYRQNGQPERLRHELPGAAIAVDQFNDGSFPHAGERRQQVTESQPKTAVRLQDVTKSYGNTCALAGLNLEFQSGGIHALLGPNGAGKSTAIGILTGIRSPDSGIVEVLGADPKSERGRKRIGLTPQDSGFPRNLRVSEILRLVRAHYPSPMPDEILFRRFPLEGILHRQTGGLSGGQGRSLAVALAFAGNPDLVFLDEPTTGLDVETRQGIWQAILDFRANGGTVILTTHYIEEAESLATNVAVIHEGKALAGGTPEEIRSLVGHSRISYRGEPPEGIDGIVAVECGNGSVRILARDSDEVVRSMVDGRIEFRDLSIRPASLEEAFLSLVRGRRGS